MPAPDRPGRVPAGRRGWIRTRRPGSSRLSKVDARPRFPNGDARARSPRPGSTRFARACQAETQCALRAWRHDSSRPRPYLLKWLPHNVADTAASDKRGQAVSRPHDPDKQQVDCGMSCYPKRFICRAGCWFRAASKEVDGVIRGKKLSNSWASTKRSSNRLAASLRWRRSTFVFSSCR